MRWRSSRWMRWMRTFPDDRHTVLGWLIAIKIEWLILWLISGQRQCLALALFIISQGYLIYRNLQGHWGLSSESGHELFKNAIFASRKICESFIERNDCSDSRVSSTELSSCSFTTAGLINYTPSNFQSVHSSRTYCGVGFSSGSKTGICHRKATF